MRNMKPRALARAALAAFLAAAPLAACKTVPASPAAEKTDVSAHIKKITYVSEDARTVIRIYGSKKFEYTSYKLADPARLAVEMPNAALDFEPKKIPVDDKIISNMSVVRFPKVNSVRLELELLMDAQFKLTQKAEYLEVALAAGVSPAPSAKNTAVSSPAPADDAERLRAENERLKGESLAARKAAVGFEEENIKLKKEMEEFRKQREEAARQFEEASALSRTLQARIAFMEDQLAEIQSKVYESGRSKEAASQPIAAPSLKVEAAPGVSTSGPSAANTPAPPLPAPIVAPAPAAVPENEGGPAGTANMEINMTVAAWVKAWKSRDISKYAAFYSRDFRTKDMGYDAWMADKRTKFASRSAIKISVQNMQITANPDGSATVVFVQRYKIGGYKDKGLKQLIFAKESGKWLIVSEEWSPL